MAPPGGSMVKGKDPVITALKGFRSSLSNSAGNSLNGFRWRVLTNKDWLALCG